MEITGAISATVAMASGAASADPTPSHTVFLSEPAAAYFRRVAYNVTVGSTRHVASGLLVEPAHGASARGIVIFSHGTMSDGGQPHSHDPTLPVYYGRFRSAQHAMMAMLTQLGYFVISPDELGLGLSQSPAQAYMNHQVLSTVAIEMLRGVQHWLLATHGRFRAGRVPELWLMGGSHGGYSTAAIQRRLQTDALLGLYQTTGSFMHAAPLDMSGAMLDALAVNGVPGAVVRAARRQEPQAPRRTTSRPASRAAYARSSCPRGTALPSTIRRSSTASTWRPTTAHPVARHLMSSARTTSSSCETRRLQCTRNGCRHLRAVAICTRTGHPRHVCNTYAPVVPTTSASYHLTRRGRAVERPISRWMAKATRTAS